MLVSGKHVYIIYRKNKVYCHVINQNYREALYLKLFQGMYENGFLCVLLDCNVRQVCMSEFTRVEICMRIANVEVSVNLTMRPL